MAAPARSIIPTGAAVVVVTGAAVVVTGASVVVTAVWITSVISCKLCYILTWRPVAWSMFRARQEPARTEIWDKSRFDQGRRGALLISSRTR